MFERSLGQIVINFFHVLQHLLVAASINRADQLGVRNVTLRTFFFSLREAIRIVRIYLFALDGVQQRLIHELHAEVPAGLQLRRNLVCLVGSDQLGDRTIVDKDFQHRTPAAAVRRSCKAPVSQRL